METRVNWKLKWIELNLRYLVIEFINIVTYRKGDETNSRVRLNLIFFEIY